MVAIKKAITVFLYGVFLCGIIGITLGICVFLSIFSGGHLDEQAMGAIVGVIIYRIGVFLGITIGLLVAVSILIVAWIEFTKGKKLQQPSQLAGKEMKTHYLILIGLCGAFLILRQVGLTYLATGEITLDGLIWFWWV
ncbi:MAG: hypothetical protein GY797_24800 [Deltaproteobacteria bacterium]|nr:hypothetical protein [Deltaproteobacteria bacterium]